MNTLFGTRSFYTIKQLFVMGLPYMYYQYNYQPWVQVELLCLVSANISSNVDPLSYVDMCIECITDPLVTVDDVMTVISQLNNSAAGHDGLPASIMKKLSNDYAIPLTHCINMSVIQGDFPDTLKIAKVIPIYKGDDKQMVQNYRPISILPFFSKIYEKIIYNHIINFLTVNDILYDKQFGFRKGHATNHATITLVDKVARA